MSELAAPSNKGFKFNLLRRIARIVQRYHPRGIDRVLRAAYHPDTRQNDHIDIAIEYDDDLLINVDTASFVEWTIFFYGHYEPEISSLIKRVVKIGDVAFDVGANIGCHTLIMGRSVGQSGGVLAVEPNPKVHTRLTENIRMNRMKQIVSLQCGLSDVACESILHVAPDDCANQGMSSLYPQALLSLDVPVKIQTLDDVMQTASYDRLDFIKIDTQGNDHKVLFGGEESIQKHRPYVLFEYNEKEWGRSQADFAMCDEFFRKKQYSLYVLDPAGILTKVKYGVPKSTNIFAVPPCG